MIPSDIALGIAREWVEGSHDIQELAKDIDSALMLDRCLTPLEMLNVFNEGRKVECRDFRNEIRVRIAHTDAFERATLEELLEWAESRWPRTHTGGNDGKP